MELIWHGTASIEARCGEGRILFDPFVPFRGSAVKTLIGDFDGFSQLFVTHCHFDHVRDLPELVKRNPGVLIHCTRAAYEQLHKKGGIPEQNLSLLCFGDEISVNGFTIRLWHGKHAVLPKADAARIKAWFKSPARGNIPLMLREFFRWDEKDECVYYEISAEGKTVALMGSMNLRDEADYPTGADLLILPYNGWPDNLPPAKRIIERLKPKAVVLDHWDDTFPPLTTPVDLEPVIRAYPGFVTPMVWNQTVHV